MAKTWRNGAAVVVVAVAASGCLIKDVRQTWYLDPAGSVTWAVAETDVRSDAQAAADRLREEAEYWAGVRAGTHKAAAGLRWLGGSAVRTRIIRDEAPYAIVTDARFQSVAEVGRRILAGLTIGGSSVLERDGDAWVWTLVVRDPHAEGSESPELAFLDQGFDELRVVLVNGRFESGTGFTIDADGRSATLDAEYLKTYDDQDRGEFVLRLRWKTF